MDLIFHKKFEKFKKALSTLEEILTEKKNTVTRDATIQRFEYTVETFWKMLKEYIYLLDKKETRSPRSTMLELKDVDFFSDEETDLALEMIQSRNLTVHAYEEKLAAKIANEIPEYKNFMEKILERIQSNLD